MLLLLLLLLPLLLVVVVVVVVVVHRLLVWCGGWCAVVRRRWCLCAGMWVSACAGALTGETLRTCPTTLARGGARGCGGQLGSGQTQGLSCRQAVQAARVERCA
jgi:hypothetical protein